MTTTDRTQRNTQAIAARLLQRAAENALELGNFPLGPTDVQCVYECWVADTGRHLARVATMGDVRDHLSALGFSF